MCLESVCDKCPFFLFIDKTQFALRLRRTML